MRVQTLVAGRLYFGIDALLLQRGAVRTVARIARYPNDATGVTAQTLREDFQLDVTGANALLRSFLAGELLERVSGLAEYRLTERFRAFALARVVPPLQREKAKELVEAITALAARINAASTRNPLMIGSIAISGSYMKRSSKVSELTIWPVVQPRPAGRPRRWHGPVSKAQGAQQIKKAMQALSPFIVVRLIVDPTVVERPFCVVFEAADVLPEPAALVLFRDISDSFRRRFAKARVQPSM